MTSANDTNEVDDPVWDATDEEWDRLSGVPLTAIETGKPVTMGVTEARQRTARRAHGGCLGVWSR